MGEIAVKDGSGNTKYIAFASGTGASGSGFAGYGADILTALGAIKTAVEALDNAIAGSEMQVDIVSIAAGDNNIGNVDIVTMPNVTIGSALPAGTNAIGKLAANSGVDIGDVDIASIAAGDNNIGNVDVVTLPALPAGTNNIGDVDVLSIAAGENVIGLVGASDIVVTVTPTLDTSAYTSGDLLFDSTAVANAVRQSGGCAVLQSVTVIDKDDQGAALTLLVANANTDFGTVNSAPDPDDTEAATVIGHVAIATGDYVDLGGAKVACVKNIGALLQASGGTTIYIAAMTGGTPTHTASGLVFQLGFLRS